MQSPGNKVADQKIVIELLSKIPGSQGGMKELWSTLPLPGAAGQCPGHLGDAIYGFQAHWKESGVFHNIDGVVDPGGNTLRALNTLVSGQKARRFGANGLPPANTPDLQKTASGLRALFPVASNWQLVNAPGVSAGFIANAGIGQLDVQKDPAASNPILHIGYASLGAGMGLETGPVTFTGSTRDMRSISGMGRIYSRTREPLTFEDMCGPMAIVGITGAVSNKFYSDVADATLKTGPLPQGLSLTVFMLGVPPDIGRELLSTGIFGKLLAFAAKSRALCMSAGECIGFDASAGVSLGYGTATGNWDVFDKLKKTDAADPYIKRYEDAKKTVADTVYDKLKNLNPF